MKKPDFLKKVKSAHLVGIKGVAMTALACCLQDLGVTLSGSDVEEIFVTDPVLKQRKIHWKTGFNEKNLSSNPDLVITTAAHGGLSNPEIVAAAKRKIPVLTLAEALAGLMAGKEGISVCGVGGKTTTSALIASILSLAGRKPSFIVGAAGINSLGVAGRMDVGKEFVAEADDYVVSPGIDNRPKFMLQDPKVAVVTNIEYDHPDVYRDLNHTKQTFREFFQKLPSDGLLVGCLENQNVKETLVGLSVNCETYGFSPEADWYIEKTYYGQGQTIFSLSYRGVIFDKIIIKTPGRFNVLNATAAFAVANFLGLDPQSIKNGLADFSGTKRRFEFIGEAGKIKLYDDYAHHPTEIKEVLLAAKKWFPTNRLVVIFQPHTYSRTKALFKEFATAFGQASLVVITDIYASARESETLGVSGNLLAREISKYHPQASFQAGESQVIDFIKSKTLPGDVIMTIGAGSIFQWHKNILRALKA